jgi:ubiquinone/menaquinone biosynthesis C-methylase UbiE
MRTRPGRTDEEREYYSLNQRVYSVFAPFYDLVTFPARRLRREVAALADVDARSIVLDIGTGTGAQANAFAEKAGRVVGIDVSRSMLVIARRNTRLPNVTFQQADATALPFGDARFDVSCVSFVLHEMPASIREQTIGEMARVIKPGGTVFIIDYAPPRGTFGHLISQLVRLYERQHYLGFIRSDLHGLLRRMGLDIRDERFRLHGGVRIVIAARSGAPSA